mmetsp:Transcript_95382/g.309048  ORF Transcript_95382/g.309048 Transcript_95382/m.309048 type:complete len:417 (-) Transcript_95382:72-1322(-)
MALLAAPLERRELDAMRARFPGFRGALPEEARFWAKADIEKFLASGGTSRPQETGQRSGPSCSLLSRARLKMASERVSEATAEYRSFCQKFLESRDDWTLSGIAECGDVPRMPVADGLRSAVVVEKQRDWKARLWNMEFWRRECGEAVWLCRLRCPHFQDDAEGVDSFVVEASVEEYVEYARLLHRADRKCAEENAVAYPRLSLGGWLPFCEGMRPIFVECWRQLGPPGVKDFTARWVRFFANALSLDWHEAVARYYSVSIQATGAIDRLHTPSCGSHLWVNQVEGRKVFYLFSPQEVNNLYAGYSTGQSPVDIFFPSAKRHPLFSEAKALVVTLYLGQTLVIPSGWWWYSVAIEPSVVICHPFWNMENKVHFTESLRENFDFRAQGSRALQENIARQLESLHEQVLADEDSDMEE